MNPRPAPFLIVETGQPVASMRRHGSFAHWIRVAAGLARDEAVVVDVQRGDALPSREGFAGAIITGSAAMVTERHDWSERSAGWLRDAAHAGLPVLGICYGHQLLAHALGGEVGYHPGGLEIGTVEVTRNPHAADDALLGALPGRFAAQVVHHQSVRALPPGAVPLAGNAHEPHHAYRIGERAWGVQFHPEFSADAMRGYIDTLAPSLSDAGRDVQALRTGVRDTPDAAALLGRFARLCSAPAG